MAPPQLPTRSPDVMRARPSPSPAASWRVLRTAPSGGSFCLSRLDDPFLGHTLAVADALPSGAGYSGPPQPDASFHRKLPGYLGIPYRRPRRGLVQFLVQFLGGIPAEDRNCTAAPTRNIS